MPYTFIGIPPRVPNHPHLTLGTLAAPASVALRGFMQATRVPTALRLGSQHQRVALSHEAQPSRKTYLHKQLTINVLERSMKLLVTPLV